MQVGRFPPLIRRRPRPTGERFNSSAFDITLPSQVQPHFTVLPANADFHFGMWEHEGLDADDFEEDVTNSMPAAWRAAIRFEWSA